MTSVKKTSQSLRPQTTENTKSMGILQGIEQEYAGGHTDKERKEFYLFLMQTARTPTGAVESCESSCVSSSSHTNKIFSFKLCS